MSTNLAVRTPSAPEAPARVTVNWKEVIAFSVVAYALAWAWLAYKLFPHLSSLSASTTPTDLVQRIGGGAAILPSMFAPMVAALIMRIFISREGLRGSVGLRRPLRYYVTAIVGPAVFVVAVLLISQVAGLRESMWPQAGLLGYVPLLISMVPSVLFTFGEEYGWRGYLLPRLLPLGEIKATLLLGLIWALWHVPVLLAGFNYPGVSVWAAIVVFTIVTTALSFSYTWLYIASSASVLVAAVMHASFNTFADSLWQPPFIPEGGQLVISMIAAAALFSVATIAYAVRARRRR